MGIKIHDVTAQPGVRAGRRAGAAPLNSTLGLIRLSMNVPPHEIYRTHMAEAKLRLLAAEKISRSPTSLTGLPSLDMEFCFLQIRRIIESVTFSAMTREEARYGKLREQQRQENQRDHGDPSKDWHAPEILKRLVSLSAHALPIPIAKATQQSPGLMHYDRHEINVNHGRLIEQYERCGGYMHGKNPLVDDYAALVNTERAKYEKAPDEVRRALEFLRKLLWYHAVVNLDWSNLDDPKSIDNPHSAWVVDFGTNDGQEVTIILAEAA